MDSFDKSACERAQDARKTATTNREYDKKKGNSRRITDMRSTHAQLQEKAFDVLEIHRKILIERNDTLYHLRQLNNELQSTWDLAEEIKAEAKQWMPVKGE